MPACFQLWSKETKEPTAFVKIDEDICKLFGVEPDPVDYFRYWYDAIGFRLATGKTWDEIRTDFQLSLQERPTSEDFYTTLLKIVDFLEEHYTPNSFYTRIKD